MVYSHQGLAETNQCGRLGEQLYFSNSRLANTNHPEADRGKAMTRTFETVLVEQCAPTLAGIKPASLFRYDPGTEGQLHTHTTRWAKELAPFGIAVRVLKTCPRTGASLIYLYRAGWLRQILTEPSNRRFLRQEGYTLQHGCSGLLEQLTGRLCLEEDFPHEIGVFLGYPLEDVEGFIRNQGKNYTYSGYWKAYGDPEAARRRFDCYRRCTAYFKERFQRGEPITGMVAA